MEPKFQSSFIPKGPVATAGTASRVSRESGRSLLGTLAVFVFILTLLLTVGVFVYGWYLGSRISAMGVDLATARATLKPEVITDISRLDERILSTGELLDQHIVLSPLFDYIQSTTLQSVRFTEFEYETTERGLELRMRGQARGYAAVSLQAQIFNKSQYMDSPIFSDLDLDDRGNVTFAFRATLDPSIVSYKKEVNELPAASAPAAPAQTAPAASTSTPRTTTATSTPSTSGGAAATSTRP